MFTGTPNVECLIQYLELEHIEEGANTSNSFWLVPPMGRCDVWDD